MKDIDTAMTDITTARSAIIAELDRRHKAGDKTVIAKQGTSSPWGESDPGAYIAGGGKMKCPVCHSHTLHYSRAAYNGHIYAHCSKGDCVSWME